MSEYDQAVYELLSRISDSLELIAEKKIEPMVALGMIYKQSQRVDKLIRLKS